MVAVLRVLSQLHFHDLSLLDLFVLPAAVDEHAVSVCIDCIRNSDSQLNSVQKPWSAILCSTNTSFHIIRERRSRMLRNSSKQADLFILLIAQLHRILTSLLQAFHELVEQAQYDFVVLASWHIFNCIAQLLVFLQSLKRLSYTLMLLLTLYDKTPTQSESVRTLPKPDHSGLVASRREWRHIPVLRWESSHPLPVTFPSDSHCHYS